MPPLPQRSSAPSKDGLLIAGILLIALNLRPALTAVGPLAEPIRSGTGLSNTMLGLLTTMPLLAFAGIALVTPMATRRYGIPGMLAAAMGLLTLGIGLRSMPSLAALYGGTLLLGTAIAFGNVLLPALVKQSFSKKFGLMTSMYSSAMGLGAAMAAGLTVPLADRLGGWRGALGVWAVLAVAALLLWLPQLSRSPRPRPPGQYHAGMKQLFASRLAWNVALFMGLQSFAFYVVLAWLPDMILGRGENAVFAGWMLSLSQATGVLGSLLTPLWAGKRPGQRSIIITLVVLEVMALLGLIFPALGPLQLWVALIGFALGGAFGLSLYLIVVRSRNTETATKLSGMAQAIGYSLAAAGPFLAGSLFDFTGNWNYVFILLLAVAAFKLYTGLGAARPEEVALE
jgi:CP family cyanate transporter-like MFS transporter